MTVPAVREESAGGFGGALQVRSFDEAWRLAKVVCQSGFAPKGSTPEYCLVAMQFGSELGLPPMQALQNVAVINGRPAVFGDAALAICRSHPQWGGIEERPNEGSGDEFGWVCTAKRRGETDTVRSFTVQDAKRAGLWGKQGPWQQYPSRMLQMRARSFALRDAFGDALRGLILAEEAGDYQVIDEPRERRRELSFESLSPAKDQEPEPATKDEERRADPPDETQTAPAEEEEKPEPKEEPSNTESSPPAQASEEYVPDPEEVESRELLDWLRDWAKKARPEDLEALKDAVGVKQFDQRVSVEKLRQAARIVEGY